MPSRKGLFSLDGDGDELTSRDEGDAQLGHDPGVTRWLETMGFEVPRRDVRNTRPEDTPDRAPYLQSTDAPTRRGSGGMSMMLGVSATLLLAGVVPFAIYISDSGNLQRREPSADVAIGTAAPNAEHVDAVAQPPAPPPVRTAQTQITPASRAESVRPGARAERGETPSPRTSADVAVLRRLRRDLRGRDAGAPGTSMYPEDAQRGTEALQPPVPMSRNTLASARVVVHARADREGSEARADSLSARIEPEVRRLEQRYVAAGPVSDEVRFFYPEDADAARELAGMLTSAGAPWRVRNFTFFRPPPSAGTLEVWLQSPP